VIPLEDILGEEVDQSGDVVPVKVGAGIDFGEQTALFRAGVFEELRGCYPGGLMSSLGRF
jgi:hypothetical protein